MTPTYSQPRDPHGAALVWTKKTKPNTTKACIQQSKEQYYNRHETQKPKARYSRLLQHQAWKWRQPILILALHKESWEFETCCTKKQVTCVLTVQYPVVLSTVLQLHTMSVLISVLDWSAVIYNRYSGLLYTNKKRSWHVHIMDL